MVSEACHATNYAALIPVIQLFDLSALRQPTLRLYPSWSLGVANHQPVKPPIKMVGSTPGKWADMAAIGAFLLSTQVFLMRPLPGTIRRSEFLRLPTISAASAFAGAAAAM
ncbi:hypothetical protein, partial [Agrobacterium tumefaciens]|uniref:hypothetical protein n=1 Tax=Agrobacterium tumefaciens TaxID=358 RepID=UPI001BA50414